MCVFPRALLAPGSLRTRFQLIFDIGSGEPVPYAAECLTRGPRHSRYERAEALFRRARRLGREPEVDRAAIAAAFEAARHFHVVERLFLNVHPATLRREPGFAAFLATLAARHRIAMGQLTVELLEHSRHELDDSLRAALTNLRAAGVRIAIDDCGASASDRVLVEACCPDFVKIDRELLWEAGRSRAQRQLLAGMLSLGGGATVAIAEGVETIADLITARDLGIQLIQGFLVGRPMQASAPRGSWRVS